MKLEPDIQNERHLEMLRQLAEIKPADILPLLEVIPIGICITDQDGYFTNVNRVYCDFYGYSPEELIGKPFTIVVPQVHRARMQALHQQFIDKKYELQGKWEVIDKQGNTRKVLSNAAYVSGTDSGGPQLITFIVEVDRSDEVLQCTVDVLRRKIVTQDIALQLSNHDIRNNLASMLQMVEILLDKQPTEEQRIWLSHLKTRSGHTLELLKASLDYAKMEQGSYERQESEFDIGQAIREEIEQLYQTILRKSIQVSLFYQDRPLGEEAVLVKADKFYLKRMFHNLLLNALEASPEAQNITIALNHKGFFSITIHNQGVIPDDVRAHFFDKFTTSGKEKGTGMGTYIAKLVVEMHEGSVAYRSSEEEGTDIIILLPRQMLLYP